MPIKNFHSGLFAALTVATLYSGDSIPADNHRGSSREAAGLASPSVTHSASVDFRGSNDQDQEQRSPTFIPASHSTKIQDFLKSEDRLELVGVRSCPHKSRNTRTCVWVCVGWGGGMMSC